MTGMYLLAALFLTYLPRTSMIIKSESSALSGIMEGFRVHPERNHDMAGTYIPSPGHSTVTTLYPADAYFL